MPPQYVLPRKPQLVQPVGGAVKQYTSKWNADSALNGGNKEWAEEDGALHSLNMVPFFIHRKFRLTINGSCVQANWRIKVLETELKNEKLQYHLMNSQVCIALRKQLSRYIE